MTESEHWRPSSTQELVTAGVWVIVSFGFFRLCQTLVRFYIFGELALGEFSLFGWKRNLANYEEEEEEMPPRTKWRISNEVISTLHSIISGFWAAYALLLYKELVYDMDATNNLFVSAGYLIHDFFDLLINEGTCRIAELLYHHIVVLVAFFIPLGLNMAMGIVVLGLLMEVNSIFLHIRSLFNLYRVEKRSLSFRCVAMLNLITFVLFRLIVTAYLCYWLFIQLSLIVFWKWFIMFFVIVSLAVSNLILFYRVMSADGFFGKKREKKPSIRAEVVVAEIESEESTEEV